MDRGIGQDKGEEEVMTEAASERIDGYNVKNQQSKMELRTSAYPVLFAFCTMTFKFQASTTLIDTVHCPFSDCNPKGSEYLLSSISRSCRRQGKTSLVRQH